MDSQFAAVCDGCAPPRSKTLLDFGSQTAWSLYSVMLPPAGGTNTEPLSKPLVFRGAQLPGLIEAAMEANSELSMEDADDCGGSALPWGTAATAMHANKTKTRRNGLRKIIRERMDQINLNGSARLALPGLAPACLDFADSAKDSNNRRVTEYPKRRQHQIFDIRELL